MRRRIWKIDGEYVAFTGKAWEIRKKLWKKVISLGGIATAKGALTSRSTILVRGRWPNNEFGAKERKAAELIRSGRPIAIVPDLDFKKLIENGRPAKVTDRVAGEPIEWLMSPTRKVFEKIAKISGPLDNVHSAKGRVEQAFLRNKLFGQADEAICCLCGQKLPTNLMVAAHIKPRSQCSRKERLDAENIVFGVCLLGCDALYERGLLAIESRGRILTASAHDCKSLKNVLTRYGGRTCPAWKTTSAKYFSWHHEKQFQG